MGVLVVQYIGCINMGLKG